MRQRTGYKVALGITAAVVVLILLPLLAITFLGRSTTSRFERVGGPASYDPETGQVDDGRGNQFDVDQQGAVTEGIERLDDGWVRFTHPDAFTIELPAVPQAAEIAGSVPGSGTVTAQAWNSVAPSGESVVVSWLPMQGTMAAEVAADPEQAMIDYVAGTEQSMGVRFTDEVVTTVDGYDARRYHVAGPGGSGDVVLVIADGGALGVVVVTPPAELEATTARVVDSISLP